MNDAHEPIPFSALSLDPRLLQAVDGLGFPATTPIQGAAMPPLLDGRDVIGRARTRVRQDGRLWAAFARASQSRRPRGACTWCSHPPASWHCKWRRRCAPTRPICVPFASPPSTGERRTAPVQRPQARLQCVCRHSGPSDRHMNRGSLDLSSVETVVLDEADEMLRMGFIDDVERVLSSMPGTRQVALFSATMPDPIRRVADRHLPSPVVVQVEARALSVGHIHQHWMCVPVQHKLEALLRVLRGVERTGTVLAFARTRVGAAEVAEELARRGVAAEALHGDLNQSARERVLKRLRDRRIDVVVATDVAARGDRRRSHLIRDQPGPACRRRDVRSPYRAHGSCRPGRGLRSRS